MLFGARFLLMPFPMSWSTLDPETPAHWNRQEMKNTKMRQEVSILWRPLGVLGALAIPINLP